jgi:heme oxygenase (mycobilin-producing)
MPIKVFIKRHIREGHVEKAVAMLGEFRSMAKKEPGYISGETLINHYDSRSITVVSTWRSIEEWVNWQNSAKRAANEAKLEGLLEVPTKYEIYDVGGYQKGVESKSAGLDSDDINI